MFGPDRIEYLPEVPTAKEQGLDVEVTQYRFMTVPKGTPEEVKDRLVEGMKATFDTEGYKQFNKQNSLTPMELSGEDVVAQLNEDKARYAELVGSTASTCGTRAEPCPRAAASAHPRHPRRARGRGRPRDGGGTAARGWSAYQIAGALAGSRSASPARCWRTATGWVRCSAGPGAVAVRGQRAHRGAVAWFCWRSGAGWTTPRRSPAAAGSRHRRRYLVAFGVLMPLAGFEIPALVLA